MPRLRCRITVSQFDVLLSSAPMKAYLSRGWIVCILGATLLGCSPPAGPGILGRWDTQTGGMIEFRAGGTALMAGPSGERQVAYRQPSANSIELSIPETGGTIRWQIVSVSEGELVVKDADGVESRLKRTTVAGITAAPAVAPPSPPTSVP
jgi:hypothetical protein